MAKKSESYKKEVIRESESYKAMARTGRYDLTDPTIESTICQYAWLDDKIEECRRILDTEGLMVEGLHGRIQNPAQGSIKAYMQMQSTALSQLKQLTAQAPERGDELDEFLTGGGDEG
jgi:hypothetical protein